MRRLVLTLAGLCAGPLAAQDRLATDRAAIAAAFGISPKISRGDATKFGVDWVNPEDANHIAVTNPPRPYSWGRFYYLYFGTRSVCWVKLRTSNSSFKGAALMYENLRSYVTLLYGTGRETNSLSKYGVEGSREWMTALSSGNGELKALWTDARRLPAGVQHIEARAVASNDVSGYATLQIAFDFDACGMPE